MQKIQIKKVQDKGILIYTTTFCAVFAVVCIMVGCTQLHPKFDIKKPADIQTDTGLRNFTISINYHKHKTLREAVIYFKQYGYTEAAKRFNEFANNEPDKDLWFAMRTFSDLLLETEYTERFSEAVSKDDYEQIKNYLPLLAKVGEYRSSKEIIKLLRKKIDVKIREIVIKTLSAVEKRENIIRSITSLTYDKQEERRVSAAWVLFSMDNDWRIIPAFERFINDDVTLIKEISAIYLAKKGNAKGMDAIISYMKMYKTANPELINALLAGGRDNILKLIDLFEIDNYDFKKDLKQSLFNMGDIVLPYLKERSLSENKYIKMTCIELIGALKATEYIEHIIGLSNTDSIEVKLAAIEALGMIEDEKAVPYLMSELSNPSQRIQETALFSIELIGVKGINYLMSKWDEVGNKIKLNIINILRYFNDPKSFDTYVAGLNDEEVNIRNASLYAMAYLKDPRSINYFIEALKSDKYSSHVAAEGLLSFGGTVVDRLIHELVTLKGEETEAERAISMILGRLKAASAVDQLIINIPKHGEDLRYNSALKALINIGKPSVPALIQSLKSNNRITRAGSAWALAQIGETDAIIHIREMVKERNPNVYINILSKSTYNNPSYALENVNAAEEALAILENYNR